MNGPRLTIRLDPALAARVEAAAAAAALSVEDYVARIIAAALRGPGVGEEVAPFEGPDVRTEPAKRYQREQGEIARTGYDRTGVSYPLEEVLRDVRADLEARLASKV